MLGILSAGFIYKIDKFYLFEQKSNSFWAFAVNFTCNSTILIYKTKKK
jgi:hypothetical protein